jgi:hypothetical protein
MITDLTEIKNYLKNKEICLLGNARSILRNPKDIDKYEIIIRMNRGVPEGKERFIGSRTDILCTSTQNTNREISQFNPKYVIWMTPNTKLFPYWLEVCHKTFQNPPEDWEELKNFYPYDKLPSTGCITINFLLKHIDFKFLTIYGFDFFKTTSHYNSPNFKQSWHPYEIEEKLIRDMVNARPHAEIINEC